MLENLKHEITSLINDKKETELTNFLTENPKFNLFEPIDDKNNNSLHRICFINSESIFSIALNHIKKNKESQDIKTLINNKNVSGFTPLHYACYKGNLEIINQLINLGADIYLKNNKGLNILHLASQGNQINILAYFIEKYNFDPMSLDDVYSTPLHWACYFGCENCADFLLSLKRVNINFCDKEGRTPLHVAIFSDNINLIKKLIRYGADKNIKDSNDNTPLEIAEMKKKKKIVKILKEGKKIFKCIILTPPIQKIERSIINIILFFILYGLSIIANFIFLMPLLNNKRTFWSYCFGNLINLILYIILICFDPGVNKKENIIKNKKEKFFLNIIEKGGDLKKYCPRCFVKKTKNMRHCFICDRCVDNFDHHCYWTNNCVGAANYKLFITFIIINILILSYNSYLDISIFLMRENYYIICDGNYFFYCKKFYKWYTPFIFKLISFVNFMVSITFDILLIALMGLHIRNYFFNKKIYKQILAQDTEEKIDILESITSKK